MTELDTVGNVSRATWMHADTETKDGLLFDMLASIYLKSCDHSRRIKSLEKARKADRAVSAGAGAIGGFLAVLAKILTTEL
jgi:hypothetical protein